jgi:hypothetical protein
MPETTMLSRTADPPSRCSMLPCRTPHPGRRAAASLPDGPRRSRLAVSLLRDRDASSIDEEPSCKSCLSE